jgi:predicted acylesterase/phospholipase RssA
MLAGGGLKIAFQAGVLQVWLDEAGIEFDHGDAVSAAAFNLAMWVQGMTGTQIANHWRNFRPIAAVGLNWSQLPRLMWAESLFTLNAFRKKFFPEWGLDWDKIRQRPRGHVQRLQLLETPAAPGHSPGTDGRFPHRHGIAADLVSACAH